MIYIISYAIIDYNNNMRYTTMTKLNPVTWLARKRRQYPNSHVVIEFIYKEEDFNESKND